MPGRFSFNPNTVDLGFPVFPKGVYRFKVGEPKVYDDEGDETTGRKPSYGIKYLLKVVSSTDHPDMVNKPYMAQFPLNESWGEQNAMSLLVTALGKKPDEAGVKEARALMADKNWDCDATAKTCGDGWHMIKEREVNLEFDAPQPLKKGKREGELANSFPTYTPV